MNKEPKRWNYFSFNDKLEQRILAKYTQAEQEQYFNLQQLYHDTLQDYEFVTSFLLYPRSEPRPAIFPQEFDKQLNFTKEEAEEASQKLYTSLEQIRNKYFENPIYKEFEAEFLKLYGEPNRYPDVFLEAVWPDWETPNPDNRTHFYHDGRVGELSKEVYALESYILLELIENPGKYSKIHELHKQYIQEQEAKDRAALDEEFKRHNLIDTLIASEWLDEDGNEKTDGLFFAALEAAKKAKEQAEKETAKEPPETIQKDYVSVLKDLYKAHIGVDKVQKNIVSTFPVVEELTGQYRMVWAVDQRGKVSKRDPVPVYISMLLSDDIKAKKRITARDETAHDAIITLYCQWIETHGKIDGFYFTTDEIWRVANGYKGNERPTPKQRESFEQSIQKLAAIRLDMDISKEIEANFITINDERIKEGRIKTNVLHIDSVQVKTEKGRTIDAHRLYAEPIFYTYAKAKNHILTVKYELLDTSDTTGNEGNTAEIRRYLLREIEQMYNGTRDNTHININTLYESKVIDTPQERAGDPVKYANNNAYHSRIKKEAARDREKIAAILQSWINKAYINGFEEIKTGRAITGFKISLNEDIKREHTKIKNQITQKD